MGDSVLLELLYSRSDRRETRIFAHASAETQDCIADAQCLHPSHTSRPNTSQGALLNRPAAAQGEGFLEVFPRVPSRPPRLLQELEALLVDRLRISDRLASTTMLLAKERDPNMAANLQLDSHRQVLTAFIQGFSAYSGLLGRVQCAFEQTLNDGIHCAVENIHVRERIREENQKRKQAAAETRAQIMLGEQAFRRGTFAKIQVVKERVERLTKKAVAAEKERDRARRQEAALEQSVAALRARNARLKTQIARENVYNSQPISGHLLTMKIRPLTDEDKNILEQEHGGHTLAYVLDQEPPPPPAPSLSLGIEGLPMNLHLTHPDSTPFAAHHPGEPDENVLQPPGPQLTPHKDTAPTLACSLDEDGQHLLLQQHSSGQLGQRKTHSGLQRLPSEQQPQRQASQRDNSKQYQQQPPLIRMPSGQQQQQQQYPGQGHSDYNQQLPIHTEHEELDHEELQGHTEHPGRAPTGQLGEAIGREASEQQHEVEASVDHNAAGVKGGKRGQGGKNSKAGGKKGGKAERSKSPGLKEKPDKGSANGGEKKPKKGGKGKKVSAPAGEDVHPVQQQQPKLMAEEIYEASKQPAQGVAAQPRPQQQGEETAGQVPKGASALPAQADSAGSQADTTSQQSPRPQAEPAGSQAGPTSLLSSRPQAATGTAGGQPFVGSVTEGLETTQPSMVAVS